MVKKVIRLGLVAAKRRSGIEPTGYGLISPSHLGFEERDALRAGLEAAPFHLGQSPRLFQLGYPVLLEPVHIEDAKQMIQVPSLDIPLEVI